MSEFGVAVSPFDLDGWQTTSQITPDFTMVFEAWSRQRTLLDTVLRAQRFGHTSIAVTWEPWAPVPLGAGNAAQGALQPRWSHDSILRGDHDAYIDAFARILRDSKLTVYLRLMHEMNGDWYPWHHDPAKYVAAWKYIRNRVRTQRGAWNVKFVWAPNPDLWRPVPADWLARLLPYWPGPASVEYVGFTMIEFGGDRDYTVEQFADRFALARDVFRKPILAMEMNVARELAEEWLDDLTAYVSNGTRPLPVVILSQGSSRASAAGETGDLAWTPATHEPGRQALLRLQEALHEN